MIDEGTLRERFPEIPWDQPVEVMTPGMEHIPTWVCRYCIALDSLRSLMRGHFGIGFLSRDDALVHIEREHHD